MVKRIFLNKFTSQFLLPLALRFHNTLYKLISRLSVLYCDGTHPKHEIIHYEKWFIDHLGGARDVLEVGSHTGKMSNILKDHVSSVTGIEIIESLVEKANKNCSAENVKFIHADATTYDFQGQSFDLVILSNVLEHIEHREEFLKKLIQNINWNNNPSFLIRVPLITREWLPVFKKNMGIDYRLDPTHYTEYTEQELKDELSASGLEIDSFDIRFGEAFIVCGVKA